MEVNLLKKFLNLNFNFFSIKLLYLKINHMKQLCDELKSEISTLKNQPVIYFLKYNYLIIGFKTVRNHYLVLQFGIKCKLD
jgi:hypothetical protein